MKAMGWSCTYFVLTKQLLPYTVCQITCLQK